MRILIDQDAVLYDMNGPWYKRHNDEYGHIHMITVENSEQFDMSKVCANNSCPADLYGYFKDASLWIEGEPLPNSIKITQQWKDAGHELGVISTTVNVIAYRPKKQWLEIYFPHIENIMFINGNIKHWAMADVLIDDGIHNHRGFQGISILFDQPWNRYDTELIRARDWQHVKAIIARIETLLDFFSEYPNGKHKKIEALVKSEIDLGIL